VELPHHLARELLRLGVDLILELLPHDRLDLVLFAVDLDIDGAADARHLADRAVHPATVGVVP
jgi:hypothetical protein